MSPTFVFYTPVPDPNSGGDFVFCNAVALINSVYPERAVVAPMFCSGNGLVDVSHPNALPTVVIGRKQVDVKALPDAYYDRREWLTPYPTVPMMTRETLESSNFVAVYGEGICGNPLCAKRSWRWVMYFPTPGLPDFAAGAPPAFQWADDDYLVYWCEPYRRLSAPIPRLTPTATFGMIFVNSWIVRILRNFPPTRKRRKRRGSSCFLIRKANTSYNRGIEGNWDASTGKQYPPVFIHPTTAVNMDGYNLPRIVYRLLQSERFYCYDLYTFYTSIAVLCGCLVIVCPPRRPMTPEEWHCGDPLLCNGMAFGDSPEQITHAQATRKHYQTILKRRLDSDRTKLLQFVDSVIQEEPR